MWLASIALWSRSREMIETSQWSPEQMKDCWEKLKRVLHGLGDLDRQRLFRMKGTLCLHRAATDAELEELRHFAPDFFEGKPDSLAGGPVEILWETVPGEASTKPCQNITFQKHESGACLPVDCGKCESCRARATFGG